MTVPITLTNLVNLQNETTAVTEINNNSTTITTAFGSALDTAGDQMEGNLDMNSNHILNLPAPISADSPLRLQDASTLNGGGTIVTFPAGGLPGQYLGKTSNTDFAVGYRDFSTEVLAGTNINVTGTTPITVAVVPNPTFNSVNISTLTASQDVVTDGSKNLISNPPTGTGNSVRSISPTLVTPVLGAASGTSLNLSGLTASSSVQTDGSKNLVSVTNTGTGNNVLATSPTLVTPVLGAATGTSLNLSGLTASSAVVTDGSKNLASTALTGTGSIVATTSPTITTPNIVGTIAGGNASAGSVGEFISSTVASGSPVALTNNVAANVTSISLTAGDWDVWGNVGFTPAGTTTQSANIAWISTTSATVATAPNGGALVQVVLTFNTGQGAVWPVGLIRINVSTTTTVFLGAFATFAVSTNGAYGFIGARRVR